MDIQHSHSEMAHGEESADPGSEGLVLTLPGDLVTRVTPDGAPNPQTSADSRENRVSHYKDQRCLTTHLSQ